MARPKKGVTFMDRIAEQSYVNEKGCFIFCGHKNEYGYGRVHVGPMLVFVHRHIFGPTNKNVLHTCDNPACWNRAHLFEGTQLDNMRDRKQKGRYSFRVNEPLAA